MMTEQKKAAGDLTHPPAATTNDTLSVPQSEETCNHIFLIDTPEKADWAVKKIKEAQRRREIFLQVCDAAEEKIALKRQEAERAYEAETGYLSQQLDRYLDELPYKDTKTQRSFPLPSGKLVRKKPKLDYQKREDELTAYLLSRGEYIKQEPKIQWGELKKILTVVDGVVIRQDTGEQVEGVTVVEVPGKFEVK